jgi:hypothetical protein
MKHQSIHIDRLTMKHKQESEDVALYVEHRQPTEEEERLFRAFMQKRKGTPSGVKKVSKSDVMKKRTRSAVVV